LRILDSEDRHTRMQPMPPGVQLILSLSEDAADEDVAWWAQFCSTVHRQSLVEMLELL
jgi:hypothetical protein